MKGVVRGAFFIVGMRWLDRFIGIISTLVLARVLIPEDFGLIAMASLVIYLADVFFDFSVHAALIQNPAPGPGHFNTAQTLRLLESSVAAMLLIAVAPFAAIYFRDERVVDVIRVLGASLMIAGLENIGIVTFQKEMKFGQDFIFVFTRRFTGFIVTLVAAWLLESYWALVIGTVAQRIAGVAASYVMHPMRPSLSLEKFREIFGFSQWMFVRALGDYFANMSHRLVVGGRENAQVMGGYSLAGDMAVMPSTELLMPLNKVLFPAFVSLKHDIAKLKRAYLLAQGVQLLVAVPASVGLAMVATEAVGLFLGDKWASTVGFLQVLALVGLISSFFSSGNFLLITLGFTRAVAVYVWCQALAFLALAFMVFPAAGAMGVAYLRLGVAVGGAALFAATLVHLFPALKLSELMANTVRPVLGALLMALAIFWAGPLQNSFPIFMVFILKILIGVSTYSLAILLMWRLWGCPQGAETYLFELVKKRTRGG